MGLFNGILNLFKVEADVRPSVLPGRNEPCWCGSGKKYKKCHQPDDQKKTAQACAINCGPT
jgi:hypothetical protein